MSALAKVLNSSSFSQKASYRGSQMSSVSARVRFLRF